MKYISSNQKKKKQKMQRRRKKISCTKLSFKLQMERYWSCGKFTAVNICSLSVICILSSCSVFSHCQYLVYFVFRPIWSSRLLWLQLTNHLAMFLSTRELPRSRGWKTQKAIGIFRNGFYHIWQPFQIVCFSFRLVCLAALVYERRE